MRQVRRLAYRTGHALRRPPPPRWRKPALRGLALAATAALVATAVHLARESGLDQRARQAIHDQAITVTDRMGMRIADIFTEGRQRTQAAEIYHILEPYYGQNILMVDIGAIQQRLQSLPWVLEATVTRQFPDSLRTRLVEHRPIALWQPTPSPALDVTDEPAMPADAAARGPALVSDRGDIIQVDSAYPFRHLPILSGAGAPQAAPELMRVLASEPGLALRATGAERVDGRRWNVFVDGRVEVRLPERDPHAAWGRLARLDRDERLLARAVEAIDLRLDDRVVVRLSDELSNPSAAARPVAATTAGRRT